MLKSREMQTNAPNLFSASFSAGTLSFLLDSALFSISLASSWFSSIKRSGDFNSITSSLTFWYFEIYCSTMAFFTFIDPDFNSDHDTNLISIVESELKSVSESSNVNKPLFSACMYEDTDWAPTCEWILWVGLRCHSSNWSSNIRHGLFTLNGNGTRTRTGNGTGILGNNAYWSLSLSQTSMNISTQYIGSCTCPGLVPIQCYRFVFFDSPDGLGLSLLTIFTSVFSVASESGTSLIVLGSFAGYTMELTASVFYCRQEQLGQEDSTYKQKSWMSRPP